MLINNVDKGASAAATADIIYKHVWKYYGFPESIVSDRGGQFISKLWKQLCKLTSSKIKLLSAFHPETNGQTEAINKEMERFLRTFVNYFQDNWT